MLFEQWSKKSSMGQSKNKLLGRGGGQSHRLVFVIRWWSQHVTRISVSLLIRDTTLYRRLGGHSFLENWMFKRLGVGIIMPEKVVLVSVVLKTTHMDVPNRQFAERTSSEKTQKDRSGQCGASMYYFENKKGG